MLLTSHTVIQPAAITAGCVLLNPGCNWGEKTYLEFLFGLYQQLAVLKYV